MPETENKKRKKTDRRVIYTKITIKESLLEEMKIKSFADVGITHVCKRADISRSTFYLHYGNLIDVLEEIIDEALKNGPPFYEHVMRVLGGCEECSKDYEDNPICMAIRRDWKFRLLFSDTTAAGIVTERIYMLYKDNYIDDLVRRIGIDEKQAEAVFHFQINGCIAAAMHMHCNDLGEWLVYRKTIDTLLGGGLKELQKKND